MSQSAAKPPMRKVQRLSRKGVDSSESKRTASQRDDDIVSSAQRCAAAKAGVA